MFSMNIPVPLNIMPAFMLLSAISLCRCQSDQFEQQHHPPTPVIGGLCKLDTPDVPIGGKQTQFFLRCEPTQESAPGEGVWVVKSRNAGSTATRIPAAALVKNEQQQQQPRKSAPKTTTYTCDLVSDAFEHGYCSTSENCLQPVYADRNAFLQCDSTNRRWVKKHCQPGFNFDFERQACIAHTSAVRPGNHFRQYPDSSSPSSNLGRPPPSQSHLLPKGIVCTFAQCSMANAPCNVGTCNDGYCCSAALGALPTANFPADHSSSSSTTTTTFATPPAEGGIANSNGTVDSRMPPSILVIALNDQKQEQQEDGGQQSSASSPTKQSPYKLPKDPLPMLQQDFPVGTSLSLQKILGALHQQRPLPELCSSGFHSPIRCSGSAGECPPGLACDVGPKLCCPVPLQKTQKRQSLLELRRIPKWPSSERGENGGVGQQQRRRMALRRRLARRRFSSFFGGGSPMNGWCSPCLPVNLLLTDQPNSLQINPNLFTANQLSDICPGGVAPLTSCASTGFCAPPLQCVQPGICCAMPAPPPVMAPPPPPLAAYACPGGLPALGQCIAGRCLSPAAVCSSPGNVCCAQAVVPAAIPATVCPDGTQAAGACVNNQCGAGFTCNQGLCCTNSSQTPRCLDGSQSIGACIGGKCGTGYTCTTGNICCPSQLNPCPPGQVSIGLAVNGRCPSGYTLFNGQCCGTQSQQSQITCPEIDSTGPCDATQQCPEPGFACDTANNWCCPQVFESEDAIGPCIQGEGGTRLCPEGYACVGENEGECKRLDTGTCPPEEQLGPCGPNQECPAGYECLEGFCCRIDNSTRYRQRRRRGAQSAFLRLISGMRK